MPISERIKYGLIFLIVIAALLLLPLPASGASDEQSQETGVIQTNLKQKSWDEIVSEQLKRKAEQDAIQQALEATRKASLQAQQAILKPKPRIVPARAIKRVTSGFSAYLKGSCVWFVSQKRAVGNWGNARDWLANARRDGFATGSVPQVGAIAWTGRGALGHVAYVVAVNGNQVTVQDSNYAGLGVITTRLTSASEWVYIY